MQRPRCAIFLLIAVISCDKISRTSSSGVGAGSAISATTKAKPSASAVSSAEAGPLIGLDGKLAQLEVHQGGGARIYARAPRTWIYAAPNSGATKLGAIRAGMSLATASSPVGREGCADGWYAVAPQGYICAGGDATLDKNDPVVRALGDYPADVTRRLPFIYGTVRRPGPIYRRLPTPEELERFEPDLGKRMPLWLDAGGEVGASYAQQVWVDAGTEPLDPRVAWESRHSDEPPWFLAQGRTPPSVPGHAPLNDPLYLGRMEPRIGYSILKTFFFNGRRYGVTSDLALVPTDRLRPIQGSNFHGFRIPEDIDFPFAIVRVPGARHYRLDPKSNHLVPAEPATYRSAIPLTGKQDFFRGRLHYETTKATWLSDIAASRIEPARRMPAWGKNGEKWIDVNVSKQTLVLFDGTRPVYATLVSTGEDGLKDPENSKATQRGIFRIHTKYVTATMDSDEVGEEFELRDVPYVQYFEKGYALHGAYWHDRFGIPKSHGCINLAPEDARRIFFWTEPAIPPGWYAALKPLRGTVIFVHP